MCKRTNGFFVLLAMMLAVGCGDDADRALKSTETQPMEELEAGRHEEAVSRARKGVQRDISGGVAIKYDDRESREYLKSLLASKGLKYRVESRDDGEWIRWYPESDAQWKVIKRQVAQHDFDLRFGRSSEAAQAPAPR